MPAYTGIKTCNQCKKKYKPGSNNQIRCWDCRPRKFSYDIKPPKDPVDIMLDQLEFDRVKRRRAEGWT